MSDVSIVHVPGTDIRTGCPQNIDLYEPGELKPWSSH